MQTVLERLEPASALAAWQDAAARNFARFWDWSAERMGERTLRRCEVWAADPGSLNPFPNSATLLAPLTDESASEVLGALSEFYQARDGGPWLIWSAWETPDLSGHGLQLVGRPPLMVRWPWQAVAMAPPSELAIVEVGDEATLRDWRHVLVHGYPAPELATPGASPWLDVRVPGGPYRLWVGYVNGEPVSCAAAFADGAVVGVQAVATLPAARGRGYGAAMTDIAASVDPALPAVLTASDLGAPVYRRIGFREIGRFTLWSGVR